MTFVKHFEEILERCNQKFYRPKQKVGSKSHNHFTNLQTMCKTNIRIWDCFYHKCFGYRHKKNTKSPELFHQASTSSSKICVGSPIARGLGISICNVSVNSNWVHPPGKPPGISSINLPGGRDLTFESFFRETFQILR